MLHKSETNWPSYYELGLRDSCNPEIELPVFPDNQDYMKGWNDGKKKS